MFLLSYHQGLYTVENYLTFANHTHKVGQFANVWKCKGVVYTVYFVLYDMTFWYLYVIKMQHLVD